MGAPEPDGKVTCVCASSCVKRPPSFIFRPRHCPCSQFKNSFSFVEALLKSFLLSWHAWRFLYRAWKRVVQRCFFEDCPVVSLVLRLKSRLSYHRRPKLNFEISVPIFDRDKSWSRKRDQQETYSVCIPQSSHPTRAICTYLYHWQQQRNHSLPRKPAASTRSCRSKIMPI